MFDSKSFLDKLSNTAKKAIDGAQQVLGGSSAPQQSQTNTNKQAPNTTEQKAGTSNGGTQNSSSTQNNNSSYSFYEEFSAVMGLGKRFAITDKGLIFGSENFGYDQLTTICVVNPPIPLSNGTASTTANGKTLVLAFGYDQKDRFAKAMTYANEKIDEAHGNVRNYKFLLQSEQGTKLELYEDYLILYELKSGLTKVIGNSMQGGSAGDILYYSDIEVQLTESAEKLYFVISSPSGTHTIQLNVDQKQLAQEAIEYIAYEKQAESRQTDDFSTEEWDAVNGEERVFPFLGRRFVVSDEMDVFNTYRLKFHHLASRYTEDAKAEYYKKVQNLTTYLEFFPAIYAKYLHPLIKQAMEVLITEGIWTVTEDSFLDQHLEDFHDAIDQYRITTESIELTVQANQNKISNVMSFIPNLSGGGFGLKGAAKGIAAATAFNLVRDGAEVGLLKNASQINQAQQTELYQRIDPEVLFEYVFVDYWRVMLSLIAALINNGKSIWWPEEELSQQAENIFQNLSNPRFPQDKLPDVFLSILGTHPYNENYHKFMVEKFGDTPETQAIRNYFGYTDFNNPRMA